MVVKRKNIFFEYHPFEKRGGVNLDGGDFEKSLARSPFRYAPPRPRTPAPAPQRGGWVPPENSGTEYLYYYTRQPLAVVKAQAYFAK